VKRGMAGAAAAVAVAHAGPMVTSIDAVRTRLWPRLAGVGAAGTVALTFDDGPDPKSTPLFLDALDRLGWKATFFMLGSMVEKAGALPAEMADAGHEVAVHGHTHRHHLRLTPKATFEDVRRGRDTVAGAAGREPRQYRPPYGAVTSWTLLAARRAGLAPVLWTAWGRDWRSEATGEEVTSTVLRGRCNGGTVLLHDSDCTSAPQSWRSTLDALPRLADAWAAQGLTVGPLVRSTGL